MTAPFWSSLLLDVLGFAMAGSRKDGTEDVVRQRCVSFTFELQLIIAYVALTDALVILPYGLLVVNCIPIANAILFVCIMLTVIYSKDNTAAISILDYLEAALENQAYRSKCCEICNDSYQGLLNNGILFIIMVGILVFMRDLLLFLQPAIR